MFEKELMICGLRRQNDLLIDLISQLQGKPKFDTRDSLFYDVRTRQIEKNLKKLRELKSAYLMYRN